MPLKRASSVSETVSRIFTPARFPLPKTDFRGLEKLTVLAAVSVPRSDRLEVASLIVVPQFLRIRGRRKFYNDHDK